MASYIVCTQEIGERRMRKSAPAEIYCISGPLPSGGYTVDRRTPGQDYPLHKIGSATDWEDAMTIVNEHITMFYPVNMQQRTYMTVWS